ncbi:MAG: TIGR00366 family protein, partial [Halobacteria archaeon]|nr:TIGR00366 family protein [Halobacteria archaeon]
AAGYISLMTYGHGLTSSAALIMADPSLIPNTFPDYVQNGIPVEQTIGNLANLVSGVLVVAIVPLVMAAMHPKTHSNIHEIPEPVKEEISEAIDETPPAEPVPEEETYDRKGRKEEDPESVVMTFADRLNNSRVLGILIAVFPAYYFLNAWVFQGGGLANVTVNNLTLNSINAFFLFLAILLWSSPIRLVNQMKDSVQTISGIIFQFPFYAGIAGLLTGTGLATALTEALSGLATPVTWPIIGLISAGIVNIFIPSGGGQWIAQGSILLETTRQLGMPPSTAVIIEMLGDQLTNMIQPFWAIPLLAIANLRARDIIGYTTVAMLVGFIIVGATLTVFLGVLGM